MNIPQRLTISDGAMAMDGGSIALSGKDPSGKIWEVLLDWSIDGQINGTTALKLNQIPLEKRSAAEEHLLNVLRKARIEPFETPAPENPSATQRAALGPDINQYMRAIEAGPEAALQKLIDQLIANVMSDVYAKTPQHQEKAAPLKEHAPSCDLHEKPSRAQPLPGKPLSATRYEIDAPRHSFNPIEILMSLVSLAALGLLIYAALFIIRKFLL
jgi:hypothetical protein